MIYNPEQVNYNTRAIVEDVQKSLQLPKACVHVFIVREMLMVFPYYFYGSPLRRGETEVKVPELHLEQSFI